MTTLTEHKSIQWLDVKDSAEQTIMPNAKQQNIVTMTLSMESTVKDEIYRYIIEA